MNQVEGTSTEIKDPVAVLAALERAKADAKRFREEKEALETQVEDYKNKTSQVNSQLLNEKIAKHLSERGIQNADRLLKYIKLDEIKMSDNYEIVGLDTQIDDLKEDERVKDMNALVFLSAKLRGNALRNNHHILDQDKYNII